jgi:hypothetical protein
MSTRRLKTYTSETGSVYQYYFVGKRSALVHDAFAPATELIFDVHSGSPPFIAISIFLRAASLELWQRNHGRELAQPEQYAAAKMKLFRAFDENENLTGSARRLAIEIEELEELLAELGVD